jgi:hypothetical protein
VPSPAVNRSQIVQIADAPRAAEALASRQKPGFLEEAGLLDVTVPWPRRGRSLAIVTTLDVHVTSKLALLTLVAC